MAPFLLAALPALFDAVPRLLKTFTDDGQTVPERNIAAVQIAVEAAKQAVGASNEQALVETLKNDPEAAAKVRAAVDSQWAMITDASGVPDARKQDAALTQSEKGFWHSPVFWITLMLLPMVYYVVDAVLTGNFTSDVKAMVIGVVMGTVAGSIVTYWFGTTNGSARKTDLLSGKQ